MLAYLDWIGLRLMTELEYEKICRGKEVPPTPGEYAWGTDTYNDAGDLLFDGRPIESTTHVDSLIGLFSETPLRAGFAATSTSNRAHAGASFWGHLDLHNLNETMFGVESVNLNQYSVGDGSLDIFGNANVPQWFNSAVILSTQVETTSPNPISEGKTIISGNLRSPHNGFRGVIKIYPL
ncbi:MAG: hypothetical protein AAGK97_16690 [Bacteroidota bacterium]